MICDCCEKEIKNEFEILLGENVAGMVVCKDCLNDNHENHVESQIEWLNNHAKKLREAIKNIHNKYGDTLSKLDD